MGRFLGSKTHHVPPIAECCCRSARTESLRVTAKRRRRAGAAKVGVCKCGRCVPVSCGAVSGLKDSPCAADRRVYLSIRTKGASESDRIMQSGAAECRLPQKSGLVSAEGVFRCRVGRFLGSKTHLVPPIGECFCRSARSESLRATASCKAAPQSAGYRKRRG